MQITEVKVFPINEEKLRAFVSVVFDGCFMVNDIKVICGREGLFISMPSRKKKNGEFKDVAHPLNNETRRMIETQILSEYERVRAEKGEGTAEPAPAWRESAAPAAVEVPPAERQAPAVSGQAEPMRPSPELHPSRNGDHPPAESKTLEEVEELHLRDSFWTVT